MAASPPGWYGTPPQPPYGQMPPPARRRGRAGWIAAGAAAVVLVVVAAVATVVVVVARGDSPAAWLSGGDDPGREPQPGATPTPDAPELSGEYGVNEDLCTATDLAPVEALVPGVEIITDSGFSLLAWHWTCDYRLGDESDDRTNPNAPDGNLYIEVGTHIDVSEAERTYDETQSPLFGPFDREEEADGPWDEGLVLYRERPNEAAQYGFTNVGYRVRHGNLVVEAELEIGRSLDTGSPVPDMETALYQVVISAMEALALPPGLTEPSPTPS